MPSSRNFLWRSVDSPIRQKLLKRSEVVQFCRFLSLLQVSERQRPEALLTAANGPFYFFSHNRYHGGGFSLPKGFQGVRWYGSHLVACAWHPHFSSRSTPPPPRSREPSAHVVAAGCASLLRISCRRVLGPAYVVSHCLSYLRFQVHPVRHCTPLCAPPHPGPLLLGSHACSPAISSGSRRQAVEAHRTIPTTSIA